MLFKPTDLEVLDYQLEHPTLEDIFEVLFWIAEYENVALFLSPDSIFYYLDNF